MATRSSLKRSKKRAKPALDPTIKLLLESKIAELEETVENETPAEDDLSALESPSCHNRMINDLESLMNADYSDEEKIAMIRTKYLAIAVQNYQCQNDIVSSRAETDLSVEAHHLVQIELEKTRALKVKLEGLCRELQRQNKLVIEESKRVAGEEQAKRSELSNRFQSSIQDITAKLEQQSTERVNQYENNEELRKKLVHFVEQYEIREQHYDHQLKTRDLEMQVMKVKCRQELELAGMDAAKAEAYKAQISALRATETELRSQLSLYAEKFEQFQDTLNKSNDVFTTFKKEMEKMSKTIKKLERENPKLRLKSDKTDITLVEMADERSALALDLDSVRTQKERLEKLCRTLQTSRTAQRKKLDALEQQLEPLLQQQSTGNE